MGAWFDVQDPRGPKRLKAGVRVVGEGGPVEGAGSLHVVQQEAKLIWVLALGLWLGLPQEDACAACISLPFFLALRCPDTPTCSTNTLWIDSIKGSSDHFH